MQKTYDELQKALDECDYDRHGLREALSLAQREIESLERLNAEIAYLLQRVSIYLPRCKRQGCFVGHRCTLCDLRSLVHAVSALG
jgi:hypothetical protein